MCSRLHTHNMPSYADQWAQHPSAWYCLASQLARLLQNRPAQYPVTLQNRHSCKASTVYFRTRWKSYASKWTRNLRLPRLTTSANPTELSNARSNSTLDNTYLLTDRRHRWLNLKQWRTNCQKTSVNDFWSDLSNICHVGYGHNG